MPRLPLSLTLLLLALLAPSALAVCPAFLRNQSACTCTEYVDGSIVKCSGTGGPQVVEELKKEGAEIRELTLENANIVEIGSRAFRNLHVKKLVLDNNRIRSIQKDAFRGLESSLQELSISHNRLTEVPTEALEGLRALNVLSLRCNRIGNLSTEGQPTFQNMPSLIEVNVGCNRICEVGEKTFAEVKGSLQNVILDSNCMGEVPSKAVDGMQYLIALHMKYNKVERLGFHQLANLSSLSMLTLTGNAVHEISPNFTHNTPNLRYIYLGENNISSLAAGTMKQFAQAEIIDLSYNNLPEVTVDMFSGMENLQHLNLEANAIKDVAPGAFATTPLLLLWLPHNCLNSVSPNMFQGTPFLKQVSLAYNNIRQVQPFSFAHLANLHTLDLSNNKIQTMQPSAIMGSDFLTVRVQENPMVCSQDGFHVMNGREAINLTTEANLICQTDYVHDTTDKCPRRPVEGPVRQPCCDAAAAQEKKQQPKEQAPSTEGPTPMSPMATQAEPTTGEPSTVEAATEAPTPRPSRYGSRARKLNMDRFFRLSRRPTQATPVIHSREEHDVKKGGQPAGQQPKEQVDLVVPGNGAKVVEEAGKGEKIKSNDIPQSAVTTAQTDPTPSPSSTEQVTSATEEATTTAYEKPPMTEESPKPTKDKVRNIQSSQAVVEFSTDEHAEEVKKPGAIQAVAPQMEKKADGVVEVVKKS